MKAAGQPCLAVLGGASLGRFCCSGNRAERRFAARAADIELPDGSHMERDFAQLGAAATRMLIANLIVNERGLPDSAMTCLIDAKFHAEEAA